MSRLKKLGDVFTFKSKFFNINYYSSSDDEKEKRMWEKIYKKYKPHSSDIDFELKDLDYKNICDDVYQKVIKKYGNYRRYIIIGHRYGSGLALLFAKKHKKDCMLCVCIDNPPYLLEFFQKYDDNKNKKIADKYFETDDDLNKVLETIKTSENNVNNEIDLVYKLISYKSCTDRIKYYDDKLYIPTLFFRAFSSDPNNKFKKNWNKYAIKEKEHLEKNNDLSMFKYYLMMDADHFIWKKQEYCNMIIEQIECFMNK